MQVSWRRLIRYIYLRSALGGVAGLIFISLVIRGAVATSPQEQTEAPSTPPESGRIRFEPNVPPPDRGTPPAPYGTGSRGDCLTNPDTPPLTQLTGNRGLDLTVSEHPSFWLYVPYTPAEAVSAQYSLQAGDIELHQMDVQLPGKPGIVEIALPPTTPPLDMGTAYRWYFEVTCRQTDPSDDASLVTVTGTVQRIALSTALESDLAIAQSPLEIISAYAENQIWYETFTELAYLRLSDPENQELETIWKELLSDPDIGLERLSEVPILGEVSRDVSRLR